MIIKALHFLALYTHIQIYQFVNERKILKYKTLHLKRK